MHYGGYGGGGGGGHQNAPMPQLHPQLPESIWVLDPLTRKLKVPTHLIVPTAATATLGTTPSLCLAFLESRCRHPWCRQAHIPLAVVQRLRSEAQNAPTCCHTHKSPLDIHFLTSRFSSIEIAFHNGTKISVPTERLAVTVGLQRHLAQVVPKTKTGPSFEVSSRMVCRLHLGHRCRYLEDCNNLHVCREYDAVTSAFHESGNDRSPAAAGQPANAPNSGQPSHHSTPIAGGSPVPAGGPPPPPKYADPNSSGAGRSPPFGGLPPPSPLVSPQASFTPTPGTPMTAASPFGNASGSLSSLTPASAGSHVIHNGRTYSVQAVRHGSVTDFEFAKLAEAHHTIFGPGKFEVIDLLSSPSAGPSAPPSVFGHAHNQSATATSHSSPAASPPAIDSTAKIWGSAGTPLGDFAGGSAGLPPSMASLGALPPPAERRDRAASKPDDDRWSNQTTPQRTRVSAGVWGEATLPGPKLDLAGSLDKSA